MYIILNSVEKVKKFVNQVSKFEDEIDLVSGRRAVDAKSIMGIFSLDLSKPIKVEMYPRQNDTRIINLLREYQ